MNFNQGFNLILSFASTLENENIRNSNKWY